MAAEIRLRARRALGELSAALEKAHKGWAEQPGPQCADRLGMTRQGFAMTLNRAQWWLAGRLSR